MLSVNSQTSSSCAMTVVLAADFSGSGWQSVQADFSAQGIDDAQLGRMRRPTVGTSYRATSLPYPVFDNPLKHYLDGLKRKQELNGRAKYVHSMALWFMYSANWPPLCFSGITCALALNSHLIREQFPDSPINRIVTLTDFKLIILVIS